MFTLSNAAGTVKTPEDVAKAAKGPASHIVFGSVTYEERRGNIDETYYYHPTEHWSLNSLGLNNWGYTKYRSFIKKMSEATHLGGKNLVVSIAGFSPDEYAEMSRGMLDAGADAIELNLGCPNVWGERGRKPIPSYDPLLVADILQRVKDKLPINASVGVKISPVEDEGCLHELCAVLRDSGCVSTIVAVNTLPDRRGVREDGTPALAFRYSEDSKEVLHAGGLAGSALKKDALRVIRFVRGQFPKGSMKLIGVGGIMTAEDAVDFLDEGADGLQSGTGFYQFGNKHFVELYEKMSDIPHGQDHLSA